MGRLVSLPNVLLGSTVGYKLWKSIKCPLKCFLEELCTYEKVSLQQGNREGTCTHFATGNLLYKNGITGLKR